ncbi:MAG TPA: hypothetical protein VE777_20495 [Gaiellales bacterium]|jgi:hypothetical protein|nr:hypothetical protein [Gaiellales bacterium]
MRGANHPRRRTDGTSGPDFQGVIETIDGAEVMFDWHGTAVRIRSARRQTTLTVTHLSQDDGDRWLTDVVCVGTGEVRARADGSGRPRD